jgi:hypothetical protein
MQHEGPSVHKLSQELERLFAPPPTAPTTVEETAAEERKESDFYQEIRRLQQKRRLMSASTSAFTKPRADNIEEIEAPTVSHTSKENSACNGKWFNRMEQATQRNLAPNPLNPVATNAMALHVVNKLRKDAAAMMANDENKRAISHHHRASPIARMRDSSFEMMEPTTTTEADRIVPPNESKSDHEVKQEKGRQWKKNAKIAQRKQRRSRERRRTRHDDCTVGSASHFGTNNPIIGCVLDNVESTDLFKRLAQCGAGIYPHRACAVNEYESDGGSSSFYSTEGEDDDDHDDDSTTGEDDGVRKQRGGKHQNKKWMNRSRDSSVDHSTGPSVDTTVALESFLSDDEGDLSRSRSELNHSFRATIGNRSYPTDNGNVGNSSLNSSRTSMFSGSNTSRINHLSMNHDPTESDAPSFVHAFLQDMESKGESMLWHEETSSIDPTTVVIRLKRGYRLFNGSYCAPRLIWTDLRQNHNFGFDVFDIRSLEYANMLQLKDFPYAIPGRSVLLHLKDNTSFIFEAGTEEDVMRFVHGIKWVISRLSYNLVVGNLDGASELLDLGLVDPKRINTRRSARSEFDWSRAMDDVTELLIDNALESALEI